MRLNQFLLARFNVELDKETSTFILRIRDIQETDGATYQCQVEKEKKEEAEMGEGGERDVEESGKCECVLLPRFPLPLLLILL